MTTELSRAVSSTNSKMHIAISERARTLVKENFDVRARFAHLEELSSISADQWRNFYYAKQRINEAMLGFLVKRFPDKKTWMLTGGYGSVDRDSSGGKSPYFPFRSAPPDEHECETIGQRLNWVIRQRVADKGAKLFEYLSKISDMHGKKISPDDWAQFVLGSTEPTLDMVATICDWNSQFTLWVLLGSHKNEHQVDPTDPSSVVSWIALLEHREIQLEVEGGISFNHVRSNLTPAKAISRRKKNGNKKG
jgi:hypothetical protein